MLVTLLMDSGRLTDGRPWQKLNVVSCEIAVDGDTEETSDTPPQSERVTGH